MQDNPAILQSIQLRDEIVLPLLTIQQFALQKVKELEAAGKTDDPMYETYRKMVMRSMFGNINAVRYSA
jgi:phosphoenolpyruvate carboxylase